MYTGSGDYQYKWIEDWIKIPDSVSARENGRTHGVCVTSDGNVIIFNQADPCILLYNPDGRLINSWGNNFSGAHGMTLLSENGNDYLFLTDQYSAEVSKRTLTGDVLMQIQKPSIPYYATGEYSPTWVAVFEETKGGNGDLWVVDGYGSGLVHRYDKAGNYISTITGEEGAGRFNCPHALFFDYRKDKPELYIADRGNKRFQVYSPEGIFIRSFGEDFLSLPCGGFIKGELLYVPELCARIAILDKDDNLICFIGQNEAVCSIKGWPDHPKDLIQEGKFNSPHWLTVDQDNNIYIVEWIIGGRVIKLEKVSTLI
jgi:hypothetical protein